MASEQAALTREGEYWAFAFGGREVRLADVKGIRHLAQLLENPGREIEALALASGPGEATVPDGDVGPMLDPEAKAAYQGRLVELRAEIDRANAFNDPVRVDLARAEHDLLVGEIARATGLGGRDRRAGSAAERARLNVTRAIRTAMARIREQDDALAAHLEAQVRTGRSCVYLPDPSVQWRVSTASARPRGAEPLPAPTRYARSGDVSIAYRVVGDGPVDLVFVPGYICHLDYAFAGGMRRFLLGLAAFSRLIVFDKRGAGLSDPVGASPTLEERMDDVRAVMDACGSRRAVIFGMSEGAPIAASFAALHAERVLGLVAYGSYPAFGPAMGEYAWADQLMETWQRAQEITRTWGEGRSLELLAPSVAHRADVREAWGAFERAALSPSMARSLLDWIRTIDVRPLLGSIRAPALVMHRNEICMPIDGGRTLAQLIPDARFVELAGSDHAPITGDLEGLTGEVERFVARVASAPGAPARVLTTLACLPPGLDNDRLAELGGHRVGQSDAHLWATFDGPARAVAVTQALLDDRGAGIHCGECDLGTEGFQGPVYARAAELAGRAAAGEVLVSATVKLLLMDPAVSFADRGDETWAATSKAAVD